MHNCVMPRRLISRYLPNPKAIREHPALRPVRHLLNDPDLWHLNRRSVSGAALVGLFCAFLPIPLQMLPAAVLAVAARCNLAVTMVLVWISNPLTMPPILYFEYRLGAWLLDRRIQTGDVHLNWEWLSTHMGDIGYPLLVGSLLTSAVAGVLGLILVRVTWRLHVVSRLRLRRERRRLAKLLRHTDPGAP